MYDVLIIGSGLGGLECGALLAKRGMKVLVLERSNQPGGCMQSFRRGGLHYDTGLHYVGGLAPGQTMHKAFAELGLLDLPWERMDEDFDHVIIAGRHFAFHQGYEAFVEGLAKDFPHQRAALQSYVQRLQSITVSDMDVCAYDYLCQTFSDELLVNVVSAASMKTELRKESLPLFNFAHTCSSYIESSWRLKGDGNLLVNKLIGTIEEAGGEVRTNSKVVSLTEADGRIKQAVCADGKAYEAEYFISDIHPAVLCQMLEVCPSVRKAFRRRMTSAENTCGMFTAQLSIKPGALQYFAHNVFVYDKPNVWTMTEENDPVKGVMINQSDVKFDLVYSIGFIEHFEDTRDVIKRHVDLLANNGHLLIVLPNLLGLNGLIQKRFDRHNFDAHNLKSMDMDFLKSIMDQLPVKDVFVDYVGKPMVWLEPDASRNSKFKRMAVKTLSYSIKLIPIKGKFLSPYIIIRANKN